MTSIIPPPPASVDLQIIQDATCTFCGCVCDDIELHVKDSHITEAKKACVLGKAWFLNHSVEDRPSCLIHGQPASLEAGYQKAAEILTTGKYPIIYGLSDSPCEAQRVACSIVDWIGGTIDTTTSVCHGPSGMAFQGVGEVTCSLGEVTNRGDMIIFWAPTRRKAIPGISPNTA
jgi:formylmethanofuran dehydrogenase subunit B